MVKRLFFSLLGLGLLAALVLTTTAGSEPPRPASYQHNFAHPILGANEYSSADQARPQLSFSPAIPRFVANPMKVQVTREQDPNKSDRGLIFVYNLPDVGYVNVNEQPHRGSEQAQIQSWEKAALKKPGFIEVVNVKGKKGMLVSSEQSVGLWWLQDGLLIQVFGPNLSKSRALALATLVG